jgi:hypothetical protein
MSNKPADTNMNRTRVPLRVEGVVHFVDNTPPVDPNRTATGQQGDKEPDRFELKTPLNRTTNRTTTPSATGQENTANEASAADPNRTAEPDKLNHGITSTYNRKGCRCPLCKEANARHSRQRRLKRGDALRAIERERYQTNKIEFARQDKAWRTANPEC